MFLMASERDDVFDSELNKLVDLFANGVNDSTDAQVKPFILIVGGDEDRRKYIGKRVAERTGKEIIYELGSHNVREVYHIELSHYLDPTQVKLTDSVT